jgi:hypothetical protein
METFLAPLDDQTLQLHKLEINTTPSPFNITSKYDNIKSFSPRLPCKFSSSQKLFINSQQMAVFQNTHGLSYQAFAVNMSASLNDHEVDRPIAQLASFLKAGHRHLRWSSLKKKKINIAIFQYHLIQLNSYIYIRQANKCAKIFP